GEGSVTDIATLLCLLLVGGTTVLAAVERSGGEQSVLAAGACRKLRPIAAICLAFVIDEAVGAELRDREKTWPLQHCRGFIGIDKRVERQARKIVTRKEALGRQIAVAVEIRAG